MAKPASVQKTSRLLSHSSSDFVAYIPLPCHMTTVNILEVRDIMSSYEVLFYIKLPHIIIIIKAWLCEVWGCVV